jgi:type III secretion system YscD/HrpQ family protein
MPAHLIAEEGPLRGLLLDLSEGEEWTIGRDPDEADFVIEDSTVSRKHAKLFKTGDAVYIKNLSHVNPTLVNDEEHEDRILLKEGDRIQIGNTVFLFSDEELPTLGTEPPKAKKKKKKEVPQKSYDDIFGELEEPAPPSREAPKDIQREIDEELEVKEEAPYDTIFEGGPSDEELPFNLLSPTTLLLKVISGPNAGAEIGIERGRTYTIGKDPNSSDIIFQDLSVSRNHARLSVSPDGVIELEDLGSKNGTLVNGEPLTQKQIITPKDLIALGTTVFLLIDREAPQETIYSPMVPAYEAPKTAEELEAELAAAGAKKEAIHWKERPLPTKHLIFGASFLGIFLIIFLSFFSLFKSEKIEVAHKEPDSRLKEALNKFEDVQYSFNPSSGKLFLVGHVMTSVDYQELNYRIGQIPFVTSTENNVVIDELVWKSTNDVLSTNPAWRGMSIHSPTPGKFVANGYLQTNAEAALLSDYLTVNFPYIDRLQNNVVVEENLTIQLQSMLAMHGFGAVAFQLANGEVVLAGKYSNKMEHEYDELLKEINTLPGVNKVKNYAVATSPNDASIDLTKQFQVGGSSIHEGRGYSVVLNGKIYTLGDLVDGLKITSIESNTILLEKDGLRYKIDYAR